jgi:hypothetical protein
VDSHPKNMAHPLIARMLAGPHDHYATAWARIWQALEQDSRFYVLEVQHQDFNQHAGRIYIKAHVTGLAGGVTQSSYEDEMRCWMRTYAKKQSMWSDIRTRYLSPKPEQRGPLVVFSTVLQFEAVVCHLLRGTTTPVAPPVHDGPYHKTWRSTSFPERSIHV